MARSIDLNEILPTSLYMRVSKRIGLTETGKVEVQEVLRRLCDSGDVEIAITVLEYLTSLGDTRSLFTTTPMSMKPVDCMVVGKDNTVFFHVKLEAEGVKDNVCIAIDEPSDLRKASVRACTFNEVDYVRHEDKGGKAVTSVALEL